MLVIKAKAITDQDVVLDRQTFNQLVDRANQIEEVKVEEEKLPIGRCSGIELFSRFAKSVDNERLLLLWAANYLMPAQREDRLHELLEKNSEGKLTPAENDELDNLIDEYEQRTMEKAEALVKLNLK